MANRSTLAVSQLEDFKKWLNLDGWIIQEPKGEWEVLRAVKPGRKKPLIVYERMETNNDTKLVHLTVEDRDMGVVWAFLKANKGEPTEAERNNVVVTQAIKKMAKKLNQKLDTLYCPEDSDSFYQNGVQSAKSKMRLFIKEIVSEFSADDTPDKETPLAITYENAIPNACTCPRCKSLLYYQIGTFPNYCQSCGQHLKK